MTDKPTDDDKGDKDDSGNVVEFISRKDYEKKYDQAPGESATEQGLASAEERATLEKSGALNVDAIHDDPMSLHFAKLANQSSSRLSVPRELNRRQVVNSFMDAFDLIGGVPRLALWAHGHPTEFYKLYARLLPSQATKDVSDANEHRIIHSIPPTDLDQ